MKVIVEKCESRTLLWTVIVSSLLGMAIAPVLWGRDATRLEVEVRPSGQVRVLAQGVSYGQVLRALQKKLGLPMEIPLLADNLKVSFARIEAATPQAALEKLLDGSGLGYALLRRPGGTRLIQVMVFPSTRQQASHSPEPPRDSGSSHFKKVEGWTALVPQPQDSPESESDESPIEAPQPQVLPLSEAGIVLGLEAGPAAAEGAAGHVEELPPTAKTVVKQNNSPAVTKPLSEASGIIGAPRGASAEDVGKVKTLPLSSAGGEKQQ